MGMEVSSIERSSKKLTKSEQRAKNWRKTKSAANARHTRAATLSMKVRNSDPICKIDLGDIEHFISSFFPDRHPLPYSRLNPLHKLLSAQYVLHTSNPDMISIPFVFRMSHELQALETRVFIKRVQRKLSNTLNRNPLFWMTFEHDSGLSKDLTHANGEIQLHFHELELVREAFRSMYGRKNKGIRSSLRFPQSSRKKQTELHGEFYSVYNWPGYCTKQDHMRDRERRKARLLRIELPKPGQKFHYISRELNTLANQFYEREIVISKQILNMLAFLDSL